MMSLKRLYAFSVLVLVSAAITSCSSSSTPIAATNPTVAQMDELDVQWGLPRRVPKALNNQRRAASESSQAPATAQ